MISISKDDIFNVVNFNEVMDAIELAYKLYEKEEYNMPSRISVEHKNKTLLYMPCFINDFFGTKFLTVFPENKAKNKPVINGTMILNDYETGEAVALMDGSALTALRTGAIGGVAIKHTTPKTVKKVGLIGAGTQGFYQLLYACNVREIEQIFVYDINQKGLPAFKEKLSEALPSVKIEIAENSTKVVKNSEVIITTTTSNKPVIPDDPKLLENKHFIGIGSYKPIMREYPDCLFELLDKVYIDTEYAKEETGDLSQPLSKGLLKPDQIETFGHYLLNETNKSKIVEKTTFFKSVGMALFDLVVAKIVYEECINKNMGKKLNL